MNYEGELKIQIRSSGDGVAVTVTDTGCGIHGDIIDRIFDPLFTTKPAGEGTGLGLNISRQIIDKHHGTITVKSEPGKGASFIVWLPAVPQDGSTRHKNDKASLQETELSVH